MFAKISTMIQPFQLPVWRREDKENLFVIKNGKQFYQVKMFTDLKDCI